MDAQRFTAAPSVSPQPTLPASAREALLRSARQRVVAAEQQGRRSRTASNRQRAHAAFENYLVLMFDATAEEDAKVHGWRSCRPDHICAYIHEFLLPSHTGRDGLSVATSTLQGYMSDLASCFDSKGRTRDWCDETATGNPVRSALVRASVSDYRQHQTDSGRRPCSAVPMRAQKLQTLIQRMDEALNRADRCADAHTTFLLLRDSAMFLYLWHSGRRAQDMLYVNWADLYLQQGDSAPVAALPLWLSTPPLRSYAGFRLLVAPSRSKTEHHTRPATQALSADSRPNLCALRRLHALAAWSQHHAGGCLQLAVFVTSREDHTRLSADAAGKRVKERLQQFQLFAGETRHSFRRGHIQWCQAAEEPTSVTMQRVGITTPGTFNKYADPARHLR